MEDASGVSGWRKREALCTTLIQANGLDKDGMRADVGVVVSVGGDYQTELGKGTPSLGINT